MNGNGFTASAKPINNIWHAPFIGPLWSQVGIIHIKAGENVIKIREIKEGANIDNIFAGIYPPFLPAASAVIKASEGRVLRHSDKGKVVTVKGLGFNDGVTVLPFDTPSFEPDKAPAVMFTLDLPESAGYLEIRTLADLHVYEGRDARYAVSIDGGPYKIFSIHTEDFSARWRWNVLRGYARQTVDLSCTSKGKHKVVISFLDPGIVLQELRIFDNSRL